MKRSMKQVLLLVLLTMLAQTAMGCRDQTVGDSYPIALGVDGRRLLPTTRRSYDPRILEGTAQVIGLQGDDGSPFRLQDRESGVSTGSDDASSSGAVQSVFSKLNELARNALGGPQPGGPDSDDSNP